MTFSINMSPSVLSTFHCRWNCTCICSSWIFCKILSREAKLKKQLVKIKQAGECEITSYKCKAGCYIRFKTYRGMAKDRFVECL